MKRVKGAKEMFHIPWQDLLYYDESSPTGIRHIKDVCFGNQKTLTKAKAGDIAGSLSPNNYFVYGSSKYGNFQVHRIIWILYYGKDIPVDCLVDHIDGNSLNNNISNLRLLSEERNTRNAKIYSNNTTGVVGVYFDAKKWKNGTEVSNYWKASWMELDGTQKTKAFSIKTFGLLPAMKMACEYRLNEIRKLNEQGAGYTDRHGT